MFSSRTRWPDTPNRLSACLERRRQRNLEILDLTESNPTRCEFRFDETTVLRALAGAGALKYEPHPLGLMSAREAVAAYYAEKGFLIAPDQVVLTTGSSEAYSFLLRLLADPGDEILSPAPSYPLFEFLAGLNDVKQVCYPLVYEGAWRVDVERLAAAVTPRSRALIVVSPNNPTGNFLRHDELGELISLSERHGLAIIADEVFRDFAWEPSPQQSASTLPAGRCLAFTLNGLSKISALPQMKLGWIVVSGPEELRREALRRLEVIADTYLSVSTPVQHAAAVLLEQRRILQPQILNRVRANLAFLDEKLAGTTVSRLRADGGWYAVLRVPSVQSDERWAIELLERDGVYVHPGHFFDLAQEGYLVVSLIVRPEAFCSGVTRMLARIAGCMP